MREKQVVCIKDGTILGYVNDLEIDTDSGRLVSVVVYGKKRCFGLLGRDNDSRIPWESIEVIGEDSILVNINGLKEPRRKRNGIVDFFKI
jgi:YlmC/YmxH family sporulation protein